MKRSIPRGRRRMCTSTCSRCVRGRFNEVRDRLTGAGFKDVVVGPGVGGGGRTDCSSPPPQAETEWTARHRRRCHPADQDVVDHSAHGDGRTSVGDVDAPETVLIAPRRGRTQSRMSTLLVIAGPPGAGKTTVRSLVSARLLPSVLLRGDAFFRFLDRGAQKPWLLRQRSRTARSSGPRAQRLGSTHAGASRPCSTE